jgi:alcohol dehydrogenase (cytochrome c)
LKTTHFALSIALTLTGLAGGPALPATVDSGVSVQWSTYNNGFRGHRYSPLTEITPQNLSTLKEVCRLKVAEGGPFETGPVVVGGTMYLTRSLDTYAIDPSSCAIRWKHTYSLEEPEVKIWPVNRGVAVMGGRVFRGTTDGHLIALDADSGKLLWNDTVGDSSVQEYIVGAPLAWNGLVITGTTGEDSGVKGRVIAFDATSGREIWRFNTIPTGGETGADSWKIRDTAEIGGGGTWSTFTLDVSSGELFVPVGSPYPGFAPEYRPGDNLFTSSIVVLDAQKGTLKWWYQLVPNDSHDLDLAAAPVLYTNRDGRPLVVAAGKDGYVHGVDRLTHQRVFKTAVTTIENEHTPPSKKETRYCPSSLGGTEWNGPAYDYKTDTLFVGAVDHCMLVTSTGEKAFVNRPGSPLSMGAKIVPAKDPPPSGWLSAMDANTGAIKWKFHASAPIVAGLTATASGLLLTGDSAGNFLVLDSSSGQVLLNRNTGGGIAGGVLTYAVKGKQYIALTSGNGSRSFFGAVGSPSIVILALEGNGRVAGQGGTASDPTQASSISRGRSIYAENCSTCHGVAGEGATAPALTNVKDRRTFQNTVQWIENPAPPMPQLFPHPLDQQAVRDVANFIRTF